MEVLWKLQFRLYQVKIFMVGNYYLQRRQKEGPHLLLQALGFSQGGGAACETALLVQYKNSFALSSSARSVSVLLPQPIQFCVPSLLARPHFSRM